MGRGTAETEKMVRREVRQLLDMSPAFRRLPEDTQRSLSEDMVTAGIYLAEPEGFPANTLAGALATVPAPNADLVGAVDFPAFVGALVQGVFQAIVDASIQQMEAFGELMKSVSRTVDEFTKDGISDEAARDWLLRTCPECFERDAKSGTLRRRPGSHCTDALPRLRLLLARPPLGKLGPEEIEKTLVPAARRSLAANRQKLLATMVLMGINRIVVTEGNKY